MEIKRLFENEILGLVVILLGSGFLCIMLALRTGDGVSFLLIGLLYLLFVLLAVYFYRNAIKRKRAEEEKNISENRLIKAELEQKKQKLRALESQINPHFLYNTLDTFRGLALEGGNRELSDLIEALSAMFKYSVRYEEEMVPVNAELDYLKHYIQLQQMRFPGRFLYEEHIECPSVQLLLELCPRFVLQPIVENAIRHGLKNVRRGGHIVVSMGFREQDFFMLVEDDGCGMEMEKVSSLNQKLERALSEETLTDSEQSMGIGMMNVNRRIKMFCGEEYGIRISSSLGVGTQVEISLPKYREAETGKI